jgi:hypothetical protein
VVLAFACVVVIATWVSTRRSYRRALRDDGRDDALASSLH